MKPEQKRKSDDIMNAIFIGAMVGIIIFSIFKNSIGVFSLIPLYFIYRGFKSSREK